MFNEFRLFVNFVGKSDYMSTDLRMFKDGLIIFTYYKQTYFICTHLYFSIKDEMFNVRIKCYPCGSVMSHKQHQRIPQTLHLKRQMVWVTCFYILSKYLSLYFTKPLYVLFDLNVTFTVLRSDLNVLVEISRSLQIFCKARYEYGSTDYMCSNSSFEQILKRTIFFLFGKEFLRKILKL